MKDTKKALNYLCAVMAMLCFISMYIPIIAPQYSAALFQPANSTEAASYMLVGDYYVAREYWTITGYAFAAWPMIVRIILSLSQALLLLWAFYSVRGEAGRMGMLTTGLNLVLNAVALIQMLMMMGACRWGVVAVVAVDAIAGLILAVAQYRGNK